MLVDRQLLDVAAQEIGLRGGLPEAGVARRQCRRAAVSSAKDETVTQSLPSVFALRFGRACEAGALWTTGQWSSEIVSCREPVTASSTGTSHSPRVAVRSGL